MTEVAGLKYVVLVVKEEPNGIGRVVALRLNFIVREKRDLEIAVSAISVSPRAPVSLQAWRSWNFTA
jgi:hypothetical protein